MKNFEIGDIVVVKPEYAESLRNVYDGQGGLFNRHKVRFGISVAEGAPARIVHTTDDGVDLTDLKTRSVLTPGSVQRADGSSSIRSADRSNSFCEETMDLFHEGDIVVVKPEYSKELIRTYSSGYSNEKCKFGLAVAHGAPAKVVTCFKSETVKVSNYEKEYLTFGGSSGWLTDLEETLQRDDYLHLSSAYFDAFTPPIQDGLL